MTKEQQLLKDIYTFFKSQKGYGSYYITDLEFETLLARIRELIDEE